MRRVFVYGMLRSPERLAHVLGFGFSADAVQDRYVGAAKLSGYDVRTRHGHVTVARSDFGVVHGLLIEVTEDELHYLDRFEGVPNFYERHEITIGDEPVFIYAQRGMMT